MAQWWPRRTLILRLALSMKGLNIQIKGQITKGEFKSPWNRRPSLSSVRSKKPLGRQPGIGCISNCEIAPSNQGFHAPFIHLTKARTDVGARLSTLDIQELNQHADFKLSLAKAKSNFELDYSRPSLNSMKILLSIASFSTSVW